ncbi:YolD-like family protein [Paenibacillus xylanilyticus]|uniref:YolD-like family protein n=1 Tax=Paenibacillus xylanilyticus TaxID=248903 RepID=A0A7Y6BUG7_9BACL|nr:YolD-like family protein [Paenibacillus xylanilyticus]NUU75006.1 YolD-like family protein [Paenibacillus xylanilyticus]
MASKLSGNGLFESSRLILPEHREAILKHKKEQERRGKPVMDEQAIEEMMQILMESYNQKTEVQLVVFNPFEDEVISGIIGAFNAGRVKLYMNDEDYTWINMAEITSASL